jgi:hypothetical protein
MRMFPDKEVSESCAVIFIEINRNVGINKNFEKFFIKSPMK